MIKEELETLERDHKFTAVQLAAIEQAMANCVIASVMDTAVAEEAELIAYGQPIKADII